MGMRWEELPPFLRVEQVQELTQLGRSQIYDLTRRWRESGGREGIPVVQFGRCLRIPTAPLLRLAGIDPDQGAEAGGAGAGDAA